MNDIIEVRNVTKALGRVRAIDDVTFTVVKGEFLAVQGASGSGKTTLLSLIAGLDAADEGTIRVAGADVASMDEDELALFRRSHVGIVFQSFNLIPTLNVTENIALPLFPTGVDAREMLTRSERSAREVGLGERLAHYPGELSGGEQQRVAIARALINEPEVLLADEPTGNLDTGTGRRIVELLHRLNKERRLTIVMVTHDDAVARSAGRIMGLRDGAIADG